jgi:hypothetical protein
VNKMNISFQYLSFTAKLFPIFTIYNQIKNKYLTVVTFLKFNRKITERGTFK